MNLLIMINGLKTHFFNRLLLGNCETRSIKSAILN